MTVVDEPHCRLTVERKPPGHWRGHFLQVANLRPNRGKLDIILDALTEWLRFGMMYLESEREKFLDPSERTHNHIVQQGTYNRCRSDLCEKTGCSERWADAGLE